MSSDTGSLYPADTEASASHAMGIIGRGDGTTAQTHDALKARVAELEGALRQLLSTVDGIVGEEVVKVYSGDQASIDAARRALNPATEEGERK